MITLVQATVTRDGQEVELRGKGRHDPCVLPRAVPMVEAMMCLTLVDHVMMQKAQCELFPNASDNVPNPMGKTAQGRPQLHETAHAISGPTAAISQRVDEE